MNQTHTPPSKAKAWLSAFRLRTLPLAFSSIFLGSFVAAYQGVFHWQILLLASLTTLCLQVLSNLANDYGDSIHGADSADRTGPQRAVQAGLISAQEMKKGMIAFAALSFIFGLLLLLVAFGANLKLLLIFLGMGVAAIIAAITYTAGVRPYGYMGLGDLSVFIFFGVVGVMGVFFLYAQQWQNELLLLAIGVGALSTGVLNVNNIRDIDSDRKAGKISIPVRIGRSKAVVYHWVLLAVGVLAPVWYMKANINHVWQWAFLLVVPLFFKNGIAVSRYQDAKALDPYLKQLAISTFLFVILIGVCLLS